MKKTNEDFFVSLNRASLSYMYEVGAKPFVLYMYYRTYDTALKGVFPSLRQIALDLNIVDKNGEPSKAAVCQLKKVLVEAGWIAEVGGKIVVKKYIEKLESVKKILTPEKAETVKKNLTRRKENLNGRVKKNLTLEPVAVKKILIPKRKENLNGSLRKSKRGLRKSKRIYSDKQLVLQKRVKIREVVDELRSPTGGFAFPVDEQALSVFGEWQTLLNHPKSRYDEKRQNKILAALKKFSPGELKKALKGVTLSEFHLGANQRGVNQQGKKFDQISVIFRDAEQIEKFIEMADDAETAVKKSSTAAEPNEQQEACYRTLSAKRVNQGNQGGKNK